MKNDKLFLEKCQLKEGATVHLPPSKSESNRYLIMSALAGKPIRITNKSDSEDTLVLEKALASNRKKVNVKDSGTAMRFLTAYFTITNQHKILTGSQRMCERPIGELVRALKKLGAEITYLGRRGYPPIEVKGFNFSGISDLEIKGSISSQFISAIMMIGPCIPRSLTIRLKGEVVSYPYIRLTAALMQKLGILVNYSRKKITIYEGNYHSKKVKVDGDWSSASYWYSLFRLSDARKFTLKGLSNNPLQGDARIVSIMKGLGVSSRTVKDGVVLTKNAKRQRIVFPLLENPDLAQGLIVLCAQLRVNAKFSGLKTLAIKETNRVAALRTELKKLGVRFVSKGKDQYILAYVRLETEKPICIETYGDHRMAMAFAPLCMTRSLCILKPGVVRKSSPHFWQDLKKVTS